MDEPSTLKVLSNPAVGAFQFEGMFGDTTRWVGCERDHEASAKVDKHLFKFSDDVVEVPRTGYYVRAVADGDLIAADEATAKACRIAFDAAAVKARVAPSMPKPAMSAKQSAKQDSAAA